MKEYEPKFISWCMNYEEEEKELRRLICGNPTDTKLLKQEYEQLTGKRFRRRKDDF